ncbi:polyprenyl synthetase family protein [Dehalococcoides mccartyi]|nr:polyprenyl synthetase family protein [Dehalococcoides mccartyi]
MAQTKSNRYMQLVMDECARIVGNRLIPNSIADELFNSVTGNGLLFSDHPMALATLPIAAYEAAGGRRLEAAVPAAAAMEFILTAGDILDDLQDGDLVAEEGGHPQNYVRATELITVLLLLAEHAIQSTDSKLVHRSRITKSIANFSMYKMKAFAAQFDDAHAQDSIETTPLQVLERTQSKSGSLGKCAGTLGAILATDDPAVIELAAEYGEHLGVIYQLKNDISDLWPGYGSLDDVISGKATAPTSFSLAVSNVESGNSALSRLLENQHPQQDDREKARTEAFESGGIHFAMIQSFAHLARANTVALKLSDLVDADSNKIILGTN